MKSIGFLCFCVTAGLLIGCGSPAPTVVTSNGDEVKVEKDGSVSVKMNDGTTATMDDSGMEINEGGAVMRTGSKATLKEGDLKVKAYPGATLDQKALSRRDRGDVMEALVATYTTSDPMEKVVDFYTTELGKPKVAMTESAYFEGKEKGWTIQLTKEGTGTKMMVLYTKPTG